MVVVVEVDQVVVIVVDVVQVELGLVVVVVVVVLVVVVVEVVQVELGLVVVAVAVHAVVVVVGKLPIHAFSLDIISTYFAVLSAKYAGLNVLELAIVISIALLHTEMDHFFNVF